MNFNIDIFHKILTYITDLTRFYQLRKLKEQQEI